MPSPDLTLSNTLARGFRSDTQPTESLSHRILSVVAYPVVLAVAVGGGVALVQAEVASPLITLASFVFMVSAGFLLEWLLPYNQSKTTRPSGVIEVVNSLVNVIANSRLFGPLMALGVLKLSTALVGRSGLLPSEFFGPLWLQAILAFLVTDSSRYFIHRAQHRIPALWNFHKVHHSVEKVRTFNLQFSHPLDYLLRNVVTFYIPVLLGFSEEGIVLAVVLQHATGVPSHYNARLRFGWLNSILVTARIHRWHHALDLEDGGDANFGAGLVLWDRLFGSFHHPVDRQGPPVQGIAEGPPRSLASTLLRP